MLLDFLKKVEWVIDWASFAFFFVCLIAATFVDVSKHAMVTLVVIGCVLFLSDLLVTVLIRRL